MMQATAPPTEMLVFGLLSTVFWTAAYVLILKRGFQDKTFGLPVTVICANVAWEALYSFHFEVPLVTKVGNTAWFVIDVLIAYTCLRYGKREFQQPVIQRGLPGLVAVGIAMWALVLWAFIISFEDGFGKTSGSILALFNASMMVAMILRRNSVRGQSCYIALFIFLG